MMLIKNKTNRAWLACFLDTDGCIYVRTKKECKGMKKKQYTMASLNNSNKEILEKAKSLVDGNIYFHYREGVDKRGIKRGNNYVFIFSRKILKQALKELLPYLIVKRNKAIAALEDWV